MIGSLTPDEYRGSRGSCSRSASPETSILVAGPVRRCGQPHARPCAFCGAYVRLSKWLRATAARSRAFCSDDRAVVLSHVSVHRPGRASTAFAFSRPRAERNVRGWMCPLTMASSMASAKRARARELAFGCCSLHVDAQKRLGSTINSLPLFSLCNLQPAPSRSRRTSTRRAVDEARSPSPAA